MRTLRPAAIAARSVKPMLAICGWLYVQPGIRVRSSGCESRPAMCSMHAIAFVAGLVRETRRTRDITDRVDARFVRFAARVRADEPAVGCDACVLRDRGPRCCQKRPLRGSRDRSSLRVPSTEALADFSVTVRPAFVFCSDSERRFGADHDARGFERLAGEGGDFAVFDRQDLRQGFDDRHFACRASGRGSRTPRRSRRRR